MSFGRLLGNLVSDLVRGNVASGFSRAARDAQYSASSAARTATEGMVRKLSEGSGSGSGDEDGAFVLIQAMVAAAGADGEVDADERSKILERALEAELSAADRQKLEAELAAPKSAEAVAALVTQPEHKELAYRLSLQTIVVDTDEERDHLRRLARGLGLDDARRDAIHQELGAPSL
jgi:uncharacterized membrane protein YebE (DUF533 family)